MKKIKNERVLKILKDLKSVIELDTPNVDENELNKRLLCIAFCRLIKLHILPFEAIKDIYNYINKVKEKDRAYEVLNIWYQLSLQQINEDGLISDEQLENLIPYAKKAKLQSITADCRYWMYFESTQDLKYMTELPLSDEKLWILYHFASNCDINEWYADLWYDEIVDYKEDEENDLQSQISNLIVRLKIRELRDSGAITEDDETYLMSNIVENDWTYKIFEKSEIEKWMAAAGIKHLSILEKKGDLTNVNTK